MNRFNAPSISHRATAFAFALAATLMILSGVDMFATPSLTEAMLVQAASAPAQG